MRPSYLGPLLVALSVASVAPLLSQVPTQTDSEQITIHVTVSAHNNDPVEGLTKDDFTLIDNKHPLPITDFKVLKDTQTNIVIVLDALNLPYSEVSFARQQLVQYFSANPHLPQPTALGVLQDTGLKIQPEFTTDGNALKAQLDQSSIGLRAITPSAGVRGDEEQMQRSFNMFTGLIHQLPKEGMTRIIWISPGWPVLGPPRLSLNSSQLPPLFANVVRMANLLRQNKIVVDVINPGGASQDVGQSNRYEGFMRAPRNLNEVGLGQLSLQVIALQSGGIVLNGSNDIAGQVQEAVKQTQGGYELTFTSLPGDRPNEYHELQVKVRAAGTSVHTNAGYYARPVLSQPPHAAASPTN